MKSLNLLNHKENLIRRIQTETYSLIHFLYIPKSSICLNMLLFPTHQQTYRFRTLLSCCCKLQRDSDLAKYLLLFTATTVQHTAKSVCLFTSVCRNYWVFGQFICCQNHKKMKMRQRVSFFLLTRMTVKCCV